MTTVAPGLRPAWATLPATDGVYSPQHDSRLLVQTMERTGLIPHRRVLDLCTGSGVIAIAAAELGAAGVTAFDICARAVRCARTNIRNAAVDVDVREGPWTAALDCAPFGVVVCNPPYVPSPADAGVVPPADPPWTWNGGEDGRLVLGPLCESASQLLTVGGSMLLVQSEFSGIAESLDVLRSTGLRADIIASQWVPFGPVLSAHVHWLEASGRIRSGCRAEQLVVIRADKRRPRARRRRAKR